MYAFKKIKMGDNQTLINAINKLNNYQENNYFDLNGGSVKTEKESNNQELLYLTNPTWPPNVGVKVSIRDPNDNKWYSGIIKNTIWNTTAGVIELDKQYVYHENSLREFSEFNNGINHYLLLPSYHWQYTSEDIKLTDQLKSVNPSIKEVMNKAVDPNNKLNIGVGDSNPNVESYINKPVTQITQVSLIPNIEQSVNDIDLDNHKVENDRYFVGTNNITARINSSNDVNTRVFNSLQNYRTNIKQVTKDMMMDANNPYYKPLLSSMGVDFSEKIVDELMGNNTKSKIKSLHYSQINLILEKLKRFEIIKPDDIKLAVNRNIAVNSLITDPDDELNEGNKIIKFVKRYADGLFTDLESRIHAGYVFFTRNGAIVQDTVTKELVPNLIYFDWQYNKTIDYHTLKYIIFQNEFQKSIKENAIQKVEAENILGLEYIISLQCKSEYQMWVLKRLLMIWYGDSEIEHKTRKIKVLINHYRADPGQEFNKSNGLLPMIVIYPRYGIENARLLLSKLEYYFSLYLEDNFNKNYPEIFYKNSEPTYFVKKNNLLYYTNGSIDLKMYIKESTNCKEKINVDSLNQPMTTINGSKQMIVSNEKKK